MGTADFDEGLRHSQAQRWPQAIAAFTRAINKQFGPEAYVQRGLSYLYLHDFDQAATDFSRAIEIKPDSADAYLGRGVVQEHARKWPECIQDLSRAIAIIPSAVAFRGRGTCYQSSSDYVKAAEDFGKAIELMPQDADAYRDRGLFYLGTRKYAEAVQDLSKAIEYAPQDPAAYRMRATAERSIGNSAAADEDSRRFEELNRVRQMFTDASLAGPLRFFSSGKDSGPKVVREYKERFPKGQTQYVNWELRLAYASPPGKRVDFTIQEVWFRPDGSIDHKHEVKGRVEAGWLSEAISGGWGSENGRNWQVGTYRVAFYVAGLPITSGAFEITD